MRHILTEISNKFKLRIKYVLKRFVKRAPGSIQYLCFPIIGRQINDFSSNREKIRFGRRKPMWLIFAKIKKVKFT